MDLSLFHFLRPDWLLLIPIWLAATWFLLHRKSPQRLWENICDTRLIPFVVSGNKQRSRHGLFTLFALWGILMSLALAGPTWKQKPVPVWQPQVPLVILFDVSRSMDATDLKPDRIRRARYKLQDLFQARRGTPMALVAFSAQPFVLAPLSNDIDTLNHLAASLATDLVPVQGSRLDRALEKARTMIQQSGFQDGDILLLTDDHRASNPALQQAMSIAESGLRLSVLSVGSAEGAPIPGKEGFIRNATGQMILTSPNEDFHQQLARTGNGQWVRMSTNNQDIQTLAAGFHRPNMDNAQLSDLSINQWYDYGPWLLPPLLLLAALMFRRGLVFIVPLLIMPYPPAQAMEWNELWQNPNQRGYEAFQQGDFDEASNHFNDSRWRASALYRAGQYEQALKALGEPVTADDWYNQANMLAKTGRIPEAIAAYDQALELKPDHEDARYNKSLLEQQQEQQQTEQNQDQEQQQSSNENQQQSDQNEGESSTEDEQSAQNSKDDESPEDQQARESGEPSEQEQDSQSDESAKPEESEPGATAKDEIPMQADQNKESTDQGSSMGQSAINEEQAADEAWLRQIPDDPASLMQRMFQYEAMKNRYRSEKEAW